jgi:hypothetical protein
MAVAMQTVAAPGAGTSVVVLSWKVATESLSARTTRLPPASDYGPAVTLTDRPRRMTEYTKDIPPVVERPWRRPLWAGHRSSLVPGSESAVRYPRPYAVGCRMGAADGWQPTVNFGHSRYIGP